MRDIFRVLIFSILVYPLFGSYVQAQNVSINQNGSAPNATAGLDLDFSNKGFLLPRMTTVERDAISSPAHSLQIFNTTTKCLQIYISTNWVNIVCDCQLPGPFSASSASNITTTSFDANWGISSGATSYNLWIDDNSDFSSPIAGYNPKTGIAGTTESVSSLTCGTTYYYRVQAVNACEVGGNSNTISAATSTCCTSNTWTQKADFGGTTRYSAAGFSIGSKGYLGTGYDGSNKKDFWEYDPSVNTWTQKADFGGTARSGCIGISIGTKGYIGLGNDGAHKVDFWEYDPALNTWTQKANFGGVGRHSAGAFSIGTKGYVGTGFDGTYKKDFWEWDQLTDTWTQKTDFGGVIRRTPACFAIGGKGYMGTGLGSVPNLLQDFWEYDPTSNAWTQKANFGGSARQTAVGLSIGSKGYIGMGDAVIGAGGYANDFYEYDPATNIWTAKANFGGTARQSVVGFSIDGKGYIGTGDDGAYKKDFWEYCP